VIHFQDLLDTKHSDTCWLMCVRQLIDLYEDEFKKEDFEDLYGSTTTTTPVSKNPPFKADANKIKVIKDFYDKLAEYRRQHWEFRLTYPPSSIVQDLVDRILANNMTIPTFAKGVSVTYKIISLLYYLGFFKGGKRLTDAHISLFDSVNDAIKILLTDIDLTPGYFSYVSKSSETNSSNSTSCPICRP